MSTVSLNVCVYTYILRSWLFNPLYVYRSCPANAVQGKYSCWMMGVRWTWIWETTNVSSTSGWPETTTWPLARSISQSSTKRGGEITWARPFRVKLLLKFWWGYHNKKKWIVQIERFSCFSSGSTHHRCHPRVGCETGQSTCRWRWCRASSLCNRGRLNNVVNHHLVCFSAYF